jgi:hypothetical protein
MSLFDLFGPVGTAAGAGLSLWAGMGASSAAGAAAQASENIAGLDIEENNVRQKMMEVTARRQSMQVVRNEQRARAQATQAAVNQGAQYGSVLPGAFGGIQGQAGVNLLGISQNLQAGEQMFSLDNQINQQKMAQAAAQGQEATYQGWGQFGNFLSGNAGKIGNLGQSIYSGLSSGF